MTPTTIKTHMLQKYMYFIQNTVITRNTCVNTYLDKQTHKQANTNYGHIHISKPKHTHTHTRTHTVHTTNM